MSRRRLNRLLISLLATLVSIPIVLVPAQAASPSGVDPLIVKAPRYERCSALIELPVRASTRSGYDADIRINWGDGTAATTGSLTSGQRHVFQHVFPTFGAHTVTVQAWDSMQGKTDPMGAAYAPSGPTQAVIETVNKSPGGDTPCKDETTTRRDWLNDIMEIVQVGLGSVHITDPPQPRPAPGSYPAGYEGFLDAPGDATSANADGSPAYAPHYGWHSAYQVSYVMAWC